MLKSPDYSTLKMAATGFNERHDEVRLEVVGT